MRLLLTLLASYFLTHAVFANPVDLTGTWDVQLISCLPAEAQCHLQRTEAIHRLNFPANLHETFPWFYGEALFKREFNHSIMKADENLNMLILGSIGSIDETRINGILIGKEGHHAEASTLSAWNKVRTYEIPPGVLRQGINTIEVKVIVLDSKAGIHAGPMEITNAHAAQSFLPWIRLAREYVYLAIPLLLLVVMVSFLSAIPYWQKDDGNVFLVAAFFSYLIHSAYFIPLAFSIDYLTFNKIQWIARIWSVMFSALYFAKNLGFFKWKRETFWVIFGCALSLLTLRTSSLGGFADAMFWIQIAFLTHLFYPFLFVRQMRHSPRWLMYRRYWPPSLVVLMIYLHDCFVITYRINTPWLFHYMSIVNVIQFLNHFSFHLYMWRDRGRHDAAMDHMRDKLRMAHELHDVVGSELSQIVVLSRQDRALQEQSGLAQLASGALEKIRNFAHILKGEAAVDELPVILEKLCGRLESLHRYEIEYLANPVHVHLRKNLPKNDCPRENKDRSVIVALSPYKRMHIERMLSEWASNVIRHAQGAKRLVIGWQVRKRRVRIFFYQNAVPFHWYGKAHRGGLKSLEMRSREMSGHVSCRKLHTGALWLLVIPLDK